MSHKDSKIYAVPPVVSLSLSLPPFISLSFCLLLIHPSPNQQMVSTKRQRGLGRQNIVFSSRFPRGQIYSKETKRRPSLLPKQRPTQQIVSTAGSSWIGSSRGDKGELYMLSWRLNFVFDEFSCFPVFFWQMTFLLVQINTWCFRPLRVPRIVCYSVYNGTTRNQPSHV